MNYEAMDSSSFVKDDVYEFSLENSFSEENSQDIFDESVDVLFSEVPGRKWVRYARFGADNQLPYKIIDAIGRDEVMSQNKLFNVITCYGAGMQYMDCDTKEPCRLPEVRRFLSRNSIPSFMLEQATDMKYFFFCVAVVILSQDGKRINRLIHKEACYCRFTEAVNGKIKYVVYGNFRQGASVDPKKFEMIPLLDMRDPIGDLMQRMGREPGPDGITRVRTSERKFAVVCRFPTPGYQYYPVPYYTSILRGDWYDIKRLIAVGKKAKLKNHSSVKYQIEIHQQYWERLFKDEKITDDVKKQERIKQEKEKFKNFVAGIHNSGKLWVSSYYIDPNGRENRMVRINVIDTGKEGGDWSEDIEEASNITCYGDNIHPNLVGATPGKSQQNNSGTDKRELFTLKQALEIPFHDIMATPHNLVIEYNGWDDRVYPAVPMVQLTTLDENKDSKKVTVKKGDNNEV